MKKISIAIRALGFFLTEVALAPKTRMLNPNTTKQNLRATYPTTRIASTPGLKMAFQTEYLKHLISIRIVELNPNKGLR